MFFGVHGGDERLRSGILTRSHVEKLFRELFEEIGSQLEFGRHSLMPANPKTPKAEETIRAFFTTLYDAWGPQHWWPARSRFEVIVGAYLTHNTAWTNVERALDNLRRARVLTVRGVRRTPLSKLEKLIRSAGYFRQKARRLKTFVRFLDDCHGGSLTRMFAQPTDKLREELLALNGVGPETADSILLYAGNHPVFVVDAYTKRILERHELIPAKTSYDDVRQLFERALTPVAEECLDIDPVRQTRVVTGPRGSCHPPSPMSRAVRTPPAQVLNEMHGLMVGVGKNYCKKSQPICDQCPLQIFLPGAQ